MSLFQTADSTCKDRHIDEHTSKEKTIQNKQTATLAASGACSDMCERVNHHFTSVTLLSKIFSLIGAADVLAEAETCLMALEKNFSAQRKKTDQLRLDFLFKAKIVKTRRKKSDTRKRRNHQRGRRRPKYTVLCHQEL